QLPVGQDKTDLTDRLDAVQQLIDAQNNAQQLTDATNAVVKAEGTQTQGDVDSARPLVNLLPNGQDKTDLTDRLDAVQQLIDAVKSDAQKLADATNAVVKAEGSQLQADVDNARPLVNILPNGTAKTDLTDRLDAVQQLIDAQNNAQQLTDATNAVVKAEGSQTQGDVDSARPLVNLLPNGQDKTDLTDRLDAVQQLIDAVKSEAQKLADATNAVVKAEGSQTQADVDSARPLVNLLPNGTAKTDLTDRLDAVQQLIDAQNNAQQLTDATNAVVIAEGSQTQADVDSARPLVNLLPNGTAKTDLTDRLDAVQQLIDAQNNSQQLTDATNAVVKAEGSQTQADVDSARPLVNLLPNGQDKTDLTDRLDAVQQLIDGVKSEAQKLADATNAVVKAEGSQLQADVDNARPLVNLLPNGQDKTDLTARLDAIQVIPPVVTPIPPVVVPPVVVPTPPVIVPPVVAPKPTEPTPAPAIVLPKQSDKVMVATNRDVDLVLEIPQIDVEVTEALKVKIKINIKSPINGSKLYLETKSNSTTNLLGIERTEIDLGKMDKYGVIEVDRSLIFNELGEYKIKGIYVANGSNLETNTVDVTVFKELLIPNTVLPNLHGLSVATLKAMQAVPVYTKDAHGNIVRVPNKYLDKGSLHLVQDTYKGYYQLSDGNYIEPQNVSVHIGKGEVRKDSVNVYDKNGRFLRTIKKGQQYKVYSYNDKRYSIGGGEFIEVQDGVTYVFGWFTVTQPITLYKPDGTVERTLNVGEKYRIYHTDADYLHVGGGYKVKRDLTKFTFLKN
ncbi:hypothetical protein MHI40_22110, partial [Psychrobacillus sp. FSL H8-0510]